MIFQTYSLERPSQRKAGPEGPASITAFFFALSAFIYRHKSFAKRIPTCVVCVVGEPLMR